MSDLVTTVMDAMEGVEVWVGWGDGVADDDGSYGTLDRDSRRDLAKRVMAALLADPAAHAAMLDALVSAGVLYEETDAASDCDWRCPEWSYYLGERCGHSCSHYGGDHSGPHKCANGHTVERDPGDPPARTLRRYVTEWEVLP